MTEFVGIVRTHTKSALGDSEIDVPAITLGAPVLVPLLRIFRRNEELELHLFELTGTEDKVSGCDFISKRLADLRNTKRWLLATGLQHVRKVDEHSLCSFRTQVRHRRIGFDGTSVCLEHQVEIARLGEGVLLAARRTGRGVDKLVLTETLMTFATINERISEVLEMAGGFPNGRRRKDRCIETNDVVAHLHHRTPPCVLHITKQLHPDGAVVIGGAKPAVDLG